MPLIRAQIVYPFRTNLPKDVATNTLWFYRDEINSFEEDCDLLVPSLTTLLEDVYDAGMASYINSTQIAVSFYDMSTPPPRVPYTVPLTPGGLVSTSTIVPTEVACVVSFEGLPTPGLVQARRRGRIYLPGLGAALQMTASSGTTPFFPRWASSFITVITNAFETFLTAHNQFTTPGLYWGVYSQTLESLAPVAQGWVDDSPDTQRRRSVDASSRTLWSL